MNIAKGIYLPPHVHTDDVLMQYLLRFTTVDVHVSPTCAWAHPPWISIRELNLSLLSLFYHFYLFLVCDVIYHIIYVYVQLCFFKYKISIKYGVPSYMIGQSWRSGTKWDCKTDWLWIRSPLEEMQYLLKFIFPFLRSGVEAKHGVEFCHSPRYASKIRQKVGN